MTRSVHALGLVLSLTVTLLAGEAPPRSPEAGKRLAERIALARKALEESPQEPALRVALAKLLHFKAARGDDKARREASELLEQLHRQSPDDPLLTAYRGSSVLQSAPHAWAPWKKGELAQQGLTLLNQAVDQSPDNLEIRLIRGLSTSRLPADFGLAEQSASDVAAVATAVQAAEGEGPLGPDLAAAALYAHGVNLLLAGDPDGAHALWRLAVARWPDAPAALDAQRALE